MLVQPTLSKLEAMRLHGMAQALREQNQDDNATQLTFEERFALLVDRQLTWRQNEAMQARLRRAKLRSQACRDAEKRYFFLASFWRTRSFA